MSDSIPKSASEVAEQFRKSCGNIDEFGDTDFVCSVKEVAALISADRREREKWMPASTLPTVEGWYVVRRKFSVASVFRKTTGRDTYYDVVFAGTGEKREFDDVVEYLPQPLP